MEDELEIFEASPEGRRRWIARAGWLGLLATGLVLLAMFAWYDLAGPGSGYAFEREIAGTAGEGASREEVEAGLRARRIVFEEQPEALLIPRVGARGSVIGEAWEKYLRTPAYAGSRVSGVIGRANRRADYIVVRFSAGRVIGMDVLSLAPSF